jgi:hypothetical protein
VGRPSQLNLHGGGLQEGTPLHNATEDMHEQQPKATQTSVAVPQCLPGDGPIGFGGSVHGDPVHPRAQVCALTKDLSKDNVDPVAQNLRRVMWRGGDTSAEMKVYITTTVNFCNKLAGCIAIAAARETALMSEEIFKEAEWFLKNLTYMDDARAGTDSMERLQTLSEEMEAVAKRGCFEFKETRC